MKRIIGCILLGLILPTMAGLLTLDGKFYNYGHVHNVYPFFELFFTFIAIEIGAVLGGLLVLLIIDYLIFPEK